MTYVDGFVLAVPKTKKGDYRAFAAKMAPIFKKHGATSLVECWADDVPDGKVTSFPMAVKCADDEAVVFAWITWPDKTARDAGNKRAMQDAEAAGMNPADMPFDGQRMIFGGFEVIVEE
ncbi:MAG: DUF1428 domain-containing protein [Pseudomonadota bacterium]